MGAPQIILIIFMVMATVTAIEKDGKPRDNWSGGGMIFGQTITALLLWWGGFWT